MSTGAMGTGKPNGGAGGNHPTADAVVRRRTIIIVIAVIVVILIAAGTLAAIGLSGGASGKAAHRDAGAAAGSRPSSSASDSPTTSATPGATPGATPPPTAPVDPRFGAPVSQTVPKNGTADLSRSVTARITAITSTTAKGTQAGEVSGPAVRVELSITNGTDASISLDSVGVNAYYGSASTPASPIATEGNTPFSGTLAASQTATGSYEFSVPTSQQASLVVTVSRAGTPSIVVFQG